MTHHSITAKRPFLTLPPFKKILFATDFSVASECALKEAIRIALILRAKLLILHVFEYGETVPPPAATHFADVQELYRKAEISLNRCLKTATEAGISTETEIVGGISGPAILETIHNRRIDLAVLGTNGIRGLERLIFGSTAEEVLRKADCPVLTIGPRSRHTHSSNNLRGPVVFATDFHEKTRNAVRYAAFLANQAELSLHCIHVLPRTIETDSDGEIVPHILTEALHRLAIESGYVIHDPEYVVEFSSEISTAVVDYATRHNASLIVLGVRQASIFKAHAPAHIAYRIISEAPCPVLTASFAPAAMPALVAVSA